MQAHFDWDARDRSLAVFAGALTKKTKDGLDMNTETGIMQYMILDHDDPGMAQLRRGALAYCVLALLAQGEGYGFDIAQTLTSLSLIASEGTIYPLLARLRKEGVVDSVWRESPKGPPRRYYRLTPQGESALEDFRATWYPFRDAVDGLLTRSTP